MKDVAREVGLSITTVSRALNNYDDVAERTRARIQEVARALDYHPNVVARSLQNSQANTIGLVIPSVPHRAYHAFWSEFIGGMATTCARSGRDVLLSTVNAQDGHDHSFQRLVRGRRVDGLLICDVRRADTRIAYLQKQHLPFVAFGRTTGQHTFPYIDVDGAAGALQAMDHLIQLGHRRIAYLGVDPDFSFSHFRLSGYREALRRAELPCADELVHEGLSEVAAMTALGHLLTSPNRPTAIFAAADFLALAALKAARNGGFSVPDDLSLVVFDDNLLVQHADPPLTAVSQPNWRLGEEAATMLLERVTSPNLAHVQRLVIPTFIVRHSTAPPACPPD
jgi:LacI family transcriptional regulator